MSNTEMNRQIIQEGLDSKKSTRRQRMTDAAHDAAERKLRAVINHNAQERCEELEAAQAKECREAEIQRRRSERQAARKARNAEEIGRFNDCILRVFGSLAIAALAAIAFTYGAVIGAVAITVASIAAIYSIGTFVKYVVKRVRKSTHG